ncbi:hypothetical protein DFS34DRAFT_597905 [Phlyctochytrium arcticum]|nr:hypothetical protein DFS34DRAFT_597905 [Phlyctochytrium arcticum]
MAATSASQLRPRRRGAAKIPFLILALCVPILLGLIIGSSPTVVEAGCTCHTDAPSTIQGYLDQALGPPMTTRVSCNADVAIYMTSTVMNLPKITTRWIVPFYNKAWKFMKTNFGSCSVPRDFPAPLGPGCEDFGAPKPLLLQFGTGQSPVSDGWSGWRVRFDNDSRAAFRHYVGQAHNGWAENDYGIKAAALNLLCRSVEVASQGVHETPAYPVWGAGYFADICQYDFLNRSGYASEAAQTYTDNMAESQSSLPPGTVNARWFRDWYYPLWVEKGNTLAWHQTFFALLSQYFPASYVNNGYNLKYSRRMDVGEYVHFMSATVGRNLVPMAQTAFNTGYNATKFATARTAFPALNSMYTYP